LIDDHVVEARTGRGRAPLLPDSELITLAVAQVYKTTTSSARAQPDLPIEFHATEKRTHDS
jgi:hypothetical protein